MNKKEININEIKNKLIFNWKNDTSISKIINSFESNAIEIRFIGGCVRDTFLNAEITDIDFAVNCVPEQTIQTLKKNNLEFFDYGFQHGTITCVENNRKFEITSLRKDIRTDGRHAVVEYTQDWKLDASRRDFTFNAISVSSNGAIHDYFNGIENLNNGNLVFIGNSIDRIKEDYLRIIRFNRFLNLFDKPKTDPDDIDLMKKFSLEVKTLSKERIVSEINKIIQSKYSRFGILDEILNINSKYVNTIKHFQKIYELKNNLVCFYSLIAHNDNSDLKKRLKLWKIKNSEINVIIKIEACIKKINENLINLDSIIKTPVNENISKILSVLRYFFPISVIQQAFLYNFSIKYKQSEINNTENLNKFFNHIKSLPVAPKFPINGNDLLDLNIIEKGPIIGKILFDVEKWWVECFFKPDYDACIKKAQNIYEKH